MKRRRIDTFSVVNYLLLLLISLGSILPFVHLLSLSLSQNTSALAGKVGIWPVGFTLEAYKYVLGNNAFWLSILVTLKRLVLGVVFNIVLVVLTAYPLSKENDRFHGRTVYTWFFATTMFFGGGMIPTYIVISQLHLIDSIWALVLPGAMNVWYAVLMLNFFRGIPKEIEEAAIIDGSSQINILTRIYLPISIPSLATILLFSAVGHWNSWFDGFLYMNFPKNYPLQTYLAALIMQANVNLKATMTPDQMLKLSKVSDKTIRTAQIFLGALPIMMAYPYLQRFFIKGIVVGSVKG